MNPYCIGIYLRLSREDESDDESNSITNQRELIQNYIKKSEDLVYNQIKEFCDDGYSGTDFNRPSIQNMLSETRDGVIQCIIVKDLSRFGRDYIEVGSYLEQVFPFLGVRIISINDNYDSKRDGTNKKGLEIAFKNLMNDYYCRDISVKLKTAKLARIEQGLYHGGTPTYGYKKSSTERLKLVVDKEAAEVVKRIFKLTLAGESRSEISRILNCEAIDTPAAYRNRVLGKNCWKPRNNKFHWTPYIIIHILQNKAYLGHQRYQTVENDPVLKKRINIPKEQQKLFENAYEPIISEDDFEAAQKTFVSPRNRTNRQDSIRPLKGKIKCGYCKYSMHYYGTHKTPHYRCNQKRLSSDFNCYGAMFSEKKLEDLVLDSIRKRVELLDEKKVKSKKSFNELNFLEELKMIEIQLEKLDSGKLSMYEDFKRGKVTKEKYMLQKDDLAKKIELLQVKKAKISETLYLLEGIKQKEDMHSNNILNGANITSLSKELVGEIIDSIYIYNEDKIEIVWSYADEFRKYLYKS